MLRTLALLAALTPAAPAQAPATLEGQYHRRGGDERFVLVWVQHGEFNLWAPHRTRLAGRCRWFLDGREVRMAEVPNAVRVVVTLDADDQAAEVQAVTRPPAGGAEP